MELTSKIFVEEKNIEWEKAGEGLTRKILGYDKNIMLVKVHFNKGAIGIRHKHIHSQSTYVESGKFEVTVDSESKILSAGDGFYIPSNIEHGAVCLEEGILIDVFSPMREDFLQGKTYSNEK